MYQSGGHLVYYYAKKHWPSELPKHLVASCREVKKARAEAYRDLKFEATRNGVFVRLAGQSGSGKTTQLLPAAQAFFEKKNMKPAIVAARELAKYHPHYNEILNTYGAAEIRKRTDDFATVVMYYVMCKLTKERYDLIIDVSFASLKVESLFNIMTRKYISKNLFLMAVSPKVAEKMLSGREWRHGEELEKEFRASTVKVLQAYRDNFIKMRAIVWNFYDLEPVYDGGVQDAYVAWKKEFDSDERGVQHSIEELQSAKIDYIIKH